MCHDRYLLIFNTLSFIPCLYRLIDSHPRKMHKQFPLLQMALSHRKSSKTIRVGVAEILMMQSNMGSEFSNGVWQMNSYRCREENPPSAGSTLWGGNPYIYSPSHYSNKKQQDACTHLRTPLQWVLSDFSLLQRWQGGWNNKHSKKRCKMYSVACFEEHKKTFMCPLVRI